MKCVWVCVVFLCRVCSRYFCSCEAINFYDSSRKRRRTLAVLMLYQHSIEDTDNGSQRIFHFKSPTGYTYYFWPLSKSALRPE